MRTPPGVRAYPPLLMPDDRHLLFSSPHAVYGVHLWSMRGWSSSNERWYNTLVDCGGQSRVKIAAAPVVLSEGKFGLLLQDEDGFRWGVFDLDPMRNGVPLPDVMARSVALRLTGQTAVVWTVLGQLLAFATTDGHWVWKLEAARGQRTEELVPTWKSRGGDLIISAHDARASEFHFARQHVFHGNRDPQKVTWYYQVQETRRDEGGLMRAARRLDYYELNVETLTRQRGGSVGDADRTVLLGAREDPHDNRMPSTMLFASEGRVAKYAHGQLQAHQNRSMPRDVAHATGLVFADPLVVSIWCGTNAGYRNLNIYSVAHDWHRDVEVANLISNPLLWSRWLFTLEGTDDGGVAMRRRSLCP